jgi:hypothetical protein
MPCVAPKERSTGYSRTALARGVAPGKLGAMKRLLGLIAGHFAGVSGISRSPSEANGRSDCDPPATSYVYVEDDGAARELEADEVEYLNTEFHGGDGGRPYIKSRYNQLTPDKRIGGYLRREKLPPGIVVKTAADANPVERAEEAIEIAKLQLPVSFCVKSGTALEPVMDHRSGRREYGLLGVEVSSGTFDATLTSGVWRVVRTPHASAKNIEQACFADVSALSGRVIRYGWL